MDRAEETVLRIGRGYQLSQALYVAAKLGVADVLAAGPRTAEAVAHAVDARTPLLRRVLRALVAGGVFSELEDGRFANNEAAAALRVDAPGGMRDLVVNFGEEMYRAFGELLHTVRTGETAFDHVFGAPLFEYYAAHPEAAAGAAARMRARTLPAAAEFAASGVVRDARTLVDVGGGAGTLLAEVLRQRPELRGVLLERPGMLEHARGHLAQQGVADRCELVEGDFFAAVPAGGDVYVLKSVLHDWDDERCLAILHSCRAAMGDAARLAIIELLLPERMAPSDPMLSAALLDLIMLACAGGRERTEGELTRLLDRAGLRLLSTTPLTAGPHVLEAVRARERAPTRHERRAGRPWDASYHDGPPPWDTGEPQPAVVRLAGAGAFAGAVLDAGCGTGENALHVASLGLQVVGVDVAGTAVSAAREKAAERGVDADFVVADALHLDRLGRTFQTVLDCGLFHAFDHDERREYAASLASVTRRGGHLFVLCFGDAGPEPGGPHPVSRQELRAAFEPSAGWNVESISPERLRTRFAAQGVPAWLAKVERIA